MDQRTKAAEMRLLTLVAQFTVENIKRSEDIRQELQINYNVSDRISEYRSEWSEKGRK